MKVYSITILAVLLTSFLSENFFTETSGWKTNIKINKTFKVLSAFILIIVAGLRWRVGTDYFQYSRNYLIYSEVPWNSLTILGEPGIEVISKISKFIYDDYITMFMIASILTIGLSVKVVSDKSNAFTFSILLYIFIGTWHGTFNGLRQSLAVAIGFFGHTYIIEKKPIKYALSVLMAGLFHQSAFILFFFYFIPRKKLKAKHILLLALISVGLINSYDSIFNVISNFKGSELVINSYITREINLLRVLVSFAPLLVYYFMTYKSRLSQADFFYINVLFLNAILMLATSNSAYLNRFTNYSSIYLTLGMPVLINFRNKYLKFLTRSLIVIFYAVYWLNEVSSVANLTEFRWVFNR